MSYTQSTHAKAVPTTTVTQSNRSSTNAHAHNARSIYNMQQFSFTSTTITLTRSGDNPSSPDKRLQTLTTALIWRYDYAGMTHSGPRSQVTLAVRLPPLGGSLHNHCSEHTPFGKADVIWAEWHSKSARQMLGNWKTMDWLTLIP